MPLDGPEYYSTLCPVDLLGCDRLESPQAVIEHLVTAHHPRVVAIVLVRETYINRRVASILDDVPASVEREIDAMIPDPLGENDIIEIELEPGTDR